MKKLVLVALTCLMTVSAFGQSRFYKKFSAYEGMTKVYISPSMFSLMGDDVQLGLTDDVNIAGIIKNMSGLYVLSTSNPGYIAEMKKDVGDLLRAGEFEVLMEVEDGKEKVIMYLQRQEDIITDLYICADENDEFSIIYLAGKLTSEDLKEMMKSVEK
ncbi:MAG TPA: hypothetical protein DDW70_05150 [Rikenellaceae bacterium]|jgi:hypothetical protein|nr:DUF4252 domain-containing protein [Bacteroidales bacterium]HBG53579.1 hypothetical protein [Rikenellaceae bacterium]